MLFAAFRLTLRLAKQARRAYIAHKGLEKASRLARVRRAHKKLDRELDETREKARRSGEDFGRAREGMLGFAAAVGALSQSGRELGRSGGIQLRFRTNAHQVADQIDALEAELEDAARRTMQKAVQLVQAEAQRRAPVDTGTLRRSITGQVRPLGARKAGGLGATKAAGLGAQQVGLVGVVGTKLSYARAVEYGRRPGKRPPTASLRGWARRKTGSADNAYPVARAIGRRGTRPQPFLEPALEAKRGEIQRMFERELSAVVRRFQ